MPDSLPTTPSTGLLLTGGGARAAYQVGVLEAIADIRKAAALACGADNFDATVRLIAEVWKNFKTQQIYREDSSSMLRSGARWMTLLSVGWLIPKWWRLKPRSLLDNAPLGELLKQLVPLERLPYVIRKGHMHALAETASSYSSGKHIHFFGGRQAAHALGAVAAPLGTGSHHACPPAGFIGDPPLLSGHPLQIDGQTEYFGDGSMRQSAPVAAAIYLEASHIMVVGAGRMHQQRLPLGCADCRSFESACTCELMALGYADAQHQRAEVCPFFGWSDSEPPALDAQQGPRIEHRLDALRLRA